MEHIQKLLEKIHADDRRRLLRIIDALLAKKMQGLRVQKIANSDLHKVRKGRFRILFHYETNEVMIDSIRLRNENTYKRL